MLDRRTTIQTLGVLGSSTTGIGTETILPQFRAGAGQERTLTSATQVVSSRVVVIEAGGRDTYCRLARIARMVEERCGHNVILVSLERHETPQLGMGFPLDPLPQILPVFDAPRVKFSVDPGYLNVEESPHRCRKKRWDPVPKRLDQQWSARLRSCRRETRFRPELEKE